MPKNLLRTCAILALAVASLSSPVFAQDKYKAPPAIQAEFNTFIAKFRAAVKANDVSAIASMSRFPFLHMSDLYDEPAFRKQVYPKLFTSRIRSCLQRGKGAYALDGLGNHNYSLFCDQTIFLMAKGKNDTEFKFAETGPDD
jgi:hypothetical protein